jgi:beta-glucanase (GH16 family)
MSHHHHQHPRPHPQPVPVPVPVPPTPPVPGPVPGPVPDPTPTPVTPTPAPSAGYTFADDFGGPAGSAPDPSNWTCDLGPNAANAQGAGEPVTYVAANAYLDGANLIIALTPNGDGTFKSCQIHSKFSQQYGTWEAAIQLPTAVGCWPAWWFMGEGNGGSAAWPANGEMDAVELMGGTNTMTANGDSGAPPMVSQNYPTTDGGWHVYRMVQTVGQFEFYMDNSLVWTVTANDLPSGTWAFDDADNPLYNLIDFAVGGPGTAIGGTAPSKNTTAYLTLGYVHCWK